MSGEAVASGTTLSFSGTEIVAALGLEGSATISDGGAATDVTIEDGGMEVLNGIVVTGGTVSSGLAVSSGGGVLGFVSLAFGSGESFSYTSSGDGGVLTMTSGSDSFSVALFGQYAAGRFELSLDGAGGTLVAYTGAVGEAARIAKTLPTPEPSQPGHLISPPSHLVSQF